MAKPVYLGLSILHLNRAIMYKFWYDYVWYDECKNLIYGYRQLHCSCKQMMLTKIWQKMLQQDLILEILKQADHYLKEKIKKVIRPTKYELGG